jgi:predicted DCC family thiol-disulfide oxidoreductase YuxK
MIPTGMARDPSGSIWSVLYDADCGFCRWSLAGVLALDRVHRIRPVALRTQAADALLAELTPEQRVASWHLISPAGGRFSAGAAAPPLLHLLPGGRLPATALASMPKLTERVYRWVADHRSTLSRAIPERAKTRADHQIRRHAQQAQLRRG